ncbi:polysaccharide deacetylase family protein, partial [Actinomadura bangladeshensis]
MRSRIIAGAAAAAVTLAAAGCGEPAPAGPSAAPGSAAP